MSLNDRATWLQRGARARARRAGLLAIAASAALGLWDGRSRAAGNAEEKKACAVASEEAQLRRIHGKLRGARDELLVCARDVCPPLVKHDCDQWLAEVDASMPTVVVSALDAQGRDIGDVRVQLDDTPFLDKLDGTAVAIDPGEHVLRFQHGDDPPLEQRVIVREGEKNRLVQVHLQPIVALVPAPPPSPSIVAPPPPPAARSAAVPVLGWSLVAAGAIGLGIGTYFEIAQVDDFNSLKNGCSTTPAGCMQSQVDHVASERVAGGIALGVGALAAGVGTVLLVIRPRKDAPAGRVGAAWVRFGPVRGGGGLASFGGSF